MQIELLDRFSKTITVQVTIAAAEVIFSVHDRTVGRWRRDFLHAWLARPLHEITSSETTFMAVPNGVALAIEDTTLMWPLADDAVVLLLDSIEPHSAATSHLVRPRRGTRVQGP